VAVSPHLFIKSQAQVYCRQNGWIASAMSSPQVKLTKANELMTQNVAIEEYIGGVCYDAVGFARYLLGANNSLEELITTNGQGWLTKIDVIK
jgi:hypothetical protein